MDITKIDEIFSQKVKIFSEELGVSYRDIQLLIFVSPQSGQIEFNLYKEKAFVRKLRLQEDILGIKIDFLGMSQKANMFLGIVFGAFATELGCERTDVSIMVVARSNEDASACLALQKNNEFVRWVDIKAELGL
jgi:hypothetical protein